MIFRSKGTLLSDGTAGQLGLTSSDPTVNEALAAAVPLNRGIWSCRTAVPGVVLGPEMTYEHSAQFSTRIFYSTGVPTVSEFGKITFPSWDAVTITYDTVDACAEILNGRYFWYIYPAPADGTYVPGGPLYYGTGTLGNRTDGTNTYWNVPCRPAYPRLATGGWIGEFSDSDTDHTRGIAGGEEWQYAPPLLNAAGDRLRCARGFYVGTSDTGSASGRRIATIETDFYPLAVYISGAWVFRWEGSHSGAIFQWDETGLRLTAESSGTIAIDRAFQVYNYLVIGV